MITIEKSIRHNWVNDSSEYLSYMTKMTALEIFDITYNKIDSKFSIFLVNCTKILSRRKTAL